MIKTCLLPSVSVSDVPCHQAEHFGSRQEHVPSIIGMLPGIYCPFEIVARKKDFIFLVYLKSIRTFALHFLVQKKL